MRREQHLESLIAKAERRCDRLGQLVGTLRAPKSQEHERVIAFVTIELANLWSMYSRYYFLCSALRAKLGGTRVAITATGLRTEDDAMTLAVHQERPRLRGRPGPWSSRDEPDWQAPAVLDRLMVAIGASNLTGVRRGFGYPTRVFGDLPVFRNFFAHKGVVSATRARRLAAAYRISPLLSPTEILLSNGYGRPQPILADWIDDVRNVISLMT